jgi:hypothetical protein
MELVAAVVGAAPVGLVALVALGAAGFLFGRSKASAALLGIGAVLIGGGLLLVLVPPVLVYAANTGGLEFGVVELGMTVTSLLEALAHGLGTLLALIAVALGPAPARSEE